MSLDIVEIALDGMTDSASFEKLACELLRDEGYPHIVPLGGTNDLGRDAVGGVLYFSKDLPDTIFQFSLQKDVGSKMQDTLKRLREAKVPVRTLVMMTSRSMSASAQTKLKVTCLEQHRVSLEIYERKTLVNRLSNFENGIYNRFFPNVGQQIRDLELSGTIIQDDSGENREGALLRASIALTFGGRSDAARKSIFDHCLLGIILNEAKTEIATDQIAKKYAESLHVTQAPAPEQIDASLSRLSAKKMIESADGKVRASASARNSVAASIIRASEATESLVNDILEEVGAAYGKPISDNEQVILRRNTRKSLYLFFRLYGLEVSSQVLGNQIAIPFGPPHATPLIDAATRMVNSDLGEALVCVLGETLNNPSEEHAATLAHWMHAYLGICIMNLDPALSEFQATRLKGKTFFLDTDFVLDALVSECPWSDATLSVVTSLAKHGCSVLIPECCFEECLTHLEIAGKTYYAVNSSLFNLSGSYVKEKVGNVFVKGFYFGSLAGAQGRDASFKDYMENYYEPDDPRGFLLDVIRTRFPKGVEVVDPRQLLRSEVPQRDVDFLKGALYQEILTSPKALYRSEAENLQLAERDARIFLVTTYLNRQSPAQPRKILGGSHYLVTNSTRYRRCAGKAGLIDVVTARPVSLLSLLEVISSASPKAKDIMSLFENPFLIHAVSQSWSDVKKLVESGVDLKGKSLARLRRDLDSSLHNYISGLSSPEAASAEDELFDDTLQFTSMLKDAIRLGYNLHPSIHLLVNELDRTRTDKATADSNVEELTKKLDAIESQFAEFGKRKKRFLRKMTRKSS